MSKQVLAEELTSCDREPINTPGAIQAHGAVVAMRESDQCIQEVSANAERVFGCDAKAMLGTPLAPWLGSEQAKRLAKHVDRGLWNALQPITLAIPKQHAGDARQASADKQGRARSDPHRRQRWDTFVHRVNDVLVLEFEPAAPVGKATPYYRLLRGTLGRVHAARGLRQLCQRAARAVRRITQYDLVMVYRFDEDWNGEVIAEARRDGTHTYLNHHFPASDIPRQAREAFRSTWVRTIPDVHYQPVPMLQVQGRQPLDMSQAQLRSVSPIHIQYLKNMGTRATLTISLMRDGELWGLIACHHGAKSPLFHEARLACELIGKSVSSLLEARERSDEEVSERVLRGQRARLAHSIEMSESVRDGLWNDPEALLGSVDAEGAAVRIDAEKAWMLVGKTPARKQVASLASWLERHMGDSPIYVTSHFAKAYPRAKDMRCRASGLLAVSIPKAQRNFIMWFRPEEAQTKVWAGDPTKQVTHMPDGTVNIEPRHSFEDWKEAVTLRARPWTRVEVASALAVRNEVMALDLRRQFEVAQKAIRARDEFLSIASHELKTPLTTMRLQTQMTRRRLQHGPVDQARIETAMARIDDGIERLVRLVDDMLDISRISTGKLAIAPGEVELTDLAREVTDRMRALFDTASVPLEVQLGDPACGEWDRLRIEQVLWNLLSNSLRYGKGKPVHVRAGLRQGEAFFEVQDHGLGIAPADQARIFEKFERGETQQETFGLGLGLHICKNIVDLHGGRIGLHSRLGSGATFYVGLPLKS